MNKIIKLALILLVLASCAPQTRLVKVQRMVINEEGNSHAAGPIIKIEMTDKQFQSFMNQELNVVIGKVDSFYFTDGLQYPCRTLYLQPTKK